MTYFMAAAMSLRRGGKFETGALYSVITFNSTPLFWFAMILLFAFAINTNVFPLSGNASLTATPGTIGYYESVIWHMILPVVVLSISLMAESLPHPSGFDAGCSEERLRAYREIEGSEQLDGIIGIHFEEFFASTGLSHFVFDREHAQSSHFDPNLFSVIPGWAIYWSTRFWDAITRYLREVCFTSL